MSLQGEGFEEVATCDRLLGDLDRGREQLDARTVVVVDEAGMVGSRKLTRLLEHAEQAQTKLVLVGDDRQLARSTPAADSAPCGSASAPQN
jgi:ATP-dependent exoDNAse (exonuclease V) alpha subunit